MVRATLLAAAACMIGASACSSPVPGAETTTTDQNATSCGAASVAPASASTRKVSFAAEVLPIFAASCAFGSCHGSPKEDNGVFLGRKDGANEASAIRAGLVGKPSTQSPSMPYVTPADPSRSYLFRKLTGDLCGIPECDGDSCGRPMPRGGDRLDAAALETVRSWILEGATDS